MEKRLLRTIQTSCLFVLSLLSQMSAQATLTPELPRGEKIIEHPVAGRRSEICVIPRHLDSADYSPKDLKKEQFLCSLESGTNSLVRAKTNSTNPGLDFMTLPTAPEQKKLAKYKLSSSCSYTPSLLGYYHISRLLGGAGDVPPAVLRTFDLENHLKLGEEALAKTPPTEIIHATWSSLLSSLKAGARGARRDLLLTDHFDQSYGALQINPKGETFYREFFSGGTDALSRTSNFKERNLIASLLKNPNPVRTYVSQAVTAANLQKIVQMQDASEMILLDTLLSQQDRFGNIHYETKTYLVENSADGTPHLASKSDLTPEEAKKALSVKKMVLKDNDCGVAKENIAAQVDLAELIHHLEPKTYRKLLEMDARLDRPEILEFFRKEALFTPQDFQKFRDNSHKLVARLKKSCHDGSLWLDLDLQDHFFKSNPPSSSCDL